VVITIKRKKRRFIFTNTLNGGNRYYYPNEHGGVNRYTLDNDVCFGDETQSSPADPEGSWTGVPIDKDEKPLQDADDL